MQLIIYCLLIGKYSIYKYHNNIKFLERLYKVGYVHG